MKSFASESTIHSLNYIFGENRHKSVRAFWFLLFLTSFSGFSFYLYISYLKLQIIPDISMRRDEKSATNYPMAAITICPKVFLSSDYVEMISSSNMSLKRTGCEFFAANVHWCESKLYDMSCDVCERHFEEEMDKISVLNLISRSANRFTEMTEEMLLDQRIFTHHGICHTTNMLDGKAIFNEDVIHEDFKEYWSNEEMSEIEWTVEKGYLSENATYPAYINLKVIHPHEFEIKSEQEVSFCSAMYAIIHLPSEIPTEFHKFVPITYGSRSAVLITAKSHRTDEALRKFSAKSRNCYFEGEKKLKFFKTYSKPHCQLECFTNFTLDACGCVLFWMPRNQTTSVCKFSDLQCIEDTRSHKNKKFKPTCSCYPACNDIKYEVEYLPTNIMFQLTSRYA